MALPASVDPTAARALAAHLVGLKSGLATLDATIAGHEAALAAARPAPFDEDAARAMLATAQVNDIANGTTTATDVAAQIDSDRETAAEAVADDQAARTAAATGLAQARATRAELAAQIDAARALLRTEVTNIAYAVFQAAHTTYAAALEALTDQAAALAGTQALMSLRADAESPLQIAYMPVEGLEIDAPAFSIGRADGASAPGGWIVGGNRISSRAGVEDSFMVPAARAAAHELLAEITAQAGEL